MVLCFISKIIINLNCSWISTYLKEHRFEVKIWLFTILQIFGIISSYFENKSPVWKGFQKSPHRNKWCDSRAGGKPLLDYIFKSKQFSNSFDLSWALTIGDFKSVDHHCTLLSIFSQNKTSIQWTPGSQVYLNIKKKFVGQKWFLNKNK